MISVINSILLNADYFILLLMRVGALIISSPLFGRINVPQIAKIGLVLSLTYMAFLVYPPAPIAQYTTVFGFFLLIAKEFIVGVALAYITNIFFSLTFVAGQMIDMQIGFGMVNVYDPQSGTQVPVIGNILNITLLVLFLISNGHHQLIKIIYITVEKLPVGNLTFRPEIGEAALEVFMRSFLLGVMVALPVVASGLVLEVVFGTLVRSVPQMNMFVVGIPMKTMIGFFVIIAVLPVFMGFSVRIFSEMFDGVETMLNTFFNA